MGKTVYKQNDKQLEAINHNSWWTLWLLTYYSQPTINLRNSCGEKYKEMTDFWCSKVEDQYQKSESGELEILTF